MLPPCTFLNNPSTLSRALFRLSLELYLAEVLSPESRQFFETLTPLDNLSFIANREEFLLPENFAPAPLEIIWRTIDNDAAGIFCRGVTSGESGARNDFVLCAASLGQNHNGDKLAAGFIGSEKWHRHSEMQELFYAQIGMLRRYFEEFSHLKIIRSLLQEGSSYDYVLDQGSSQIIAYRCPGKSLTAVSAESPTSPISEDLLSSLLRQNHPTGEDLASPLPENMQITRFQIAGYDYAAVSLKTPLSLAVTPGGADNPRRELIHYMNNKLGALQSAVEQLRLRRDRAVSDADMKLMEIISKVSEEMAEALNRFDSESHPLPNSSAETVNSPRKFATHINRRIVLVND